MAPAVPIAAFEVACLFIVAGTLAVMARSRPWKELLLDYSALAVAGWMGEQSCVALYHFYEYSPAWHLRIGYVPVLVPLIWPLVILSARAVASAQWPEVKGPKRYALVGAIVAFDASLVEVVAVNAGLWSWAEAGHLGVPVIGILGWGYFAAGVDAALAIRNDWRRILVAPLGLIAVHGLVLASWWGLFRWAIRGELGSWGLLGIVAVAAVASLAVLGTRGRGLTLEVALPRMVAASLFIAVMALTAPLSSPIWPHALAVSAPYLLATKWRLGQRR